MQINLGDISPEEMDGGLEWIVLKGDIQVTNIYVGKSLIVEKCKQNLCGLALTFVR